MRIRGKKVKIDLVVKKEVPDFGLFIDDKGYIWKPPFKGKNGFKYGLKQIKTFSHNNEYLAIQINNKIYSTKKIFDKVVDVNYQKRFEILSHNIPDDLQKQIVKKIQS